MVGVASADHVNVHADTGVEGDCFEDVAGHGAREVTANEVVFLAGRFAVVDKVGATGDIDNCLGECLVERDGGVTEAADPPLVTECFTKCFAEADRGVFHSVVHVDVDVTAGLDREVDEGVAGQRGQHVVVERDPGVDIRGAVTVKIEGERNGRLACLPVDCCCSHASASSSARRMRHSPQVCQRILGASRRGRPLG